MADPSDCLGAMDAANAGRLDDDELSYIAEELQRARKAAAGLDGLERKMFDASEQLSRDMDAAAAVEKRNALINVVKDGQLRALARRAKDATGDASMGLEAAMVGVNAPFAGSRASVDAKAKGILRLYLGGMVADLRRAGLLGKFNSKALSQDVARELWDLSLAKPLGNATDSADAKAIAAIVHKYRRASIERENRAGAVIRYRKGYVVRQSHNIDRMVRAGYATWRDAVAARMNWDAMRIDPGRREEFLRAAYDSLVSGVRLTVGGEDESGIAFAFKGPGNLAKKESASRVLLFKSADDWFAYNEAFGRGDLNESILSDFTRSAQATALMDTFGPNPRAMFDRMRAHLRKEYESDHAQLQRLERDTLNWQFAEIDGSVNIPGSMRTLAVVGRTVRALQTMAKLGGAVISSITDIAMSASERRYQGRSLGDAWMDAFRAPFEGLATSGEKRALADMIGVGIDGMLGDFVSRFAAQDDVPGKLSKTMGLFFRLNLLGPWTDSVKRGIGMAMSRDLARIAEGGWDAIGEPMQRILAGYGIRPEDWDVVRTAVVDGPDGNRYLAPEAVRMDGETLASRRKRDRITAALSAYIADRADTASPTPGARERAFLRLGMPPGTPQGEAIRFLTQFKAFPVTILTKVLGRDLYGRGARTLGDAILRGEGDRLGLAAMIAGSTVLGLFALQAKEIVKGREPRAVDADLITAAAMQSGGLGIYGDFLFGEANRFGGGLASTVAGPAIGDALKGLELLQRLRATTFRGEAPDVGGETIRWVRGNTPFINMFYTKTALDYLIFYQLQEMSNPGYLRRMERRIKRENDQEFAFPPSRAIPRGGGDRVFEGVRG